MRKIALVLLMALAISVPLGALADDVPDGQDCRDGNAAPVTLAAAGGGESDRGAACVGAAGFTALYIGGEAQADQPENQGMGGACGAVIIADTTYAGSDDWDNTGTDPNDPSDDEHCD